VHIDLVVLGASIIAVAQSLLSISLWWLRRGQLDRDVKIKRGDEVVKINLEKPEQAELYIRDYVSRHTPSTSDARAKE
jgi:hypothetical protein